MAAAAAPLKCWTRTHASDSAMLPQLRAAVPPLALLTLILLLARAGCWAEGSKNCVQIARLGLPKRDGPSQSGKGCRELWTLHTKTWRGGRVIFQQATSEKRLWCGSWWSSLVFAASLWVSDLASLELQPHGASKGRAVARSPCLSKQEREKGFCPQHHDLPLCCLPRAELLQPRGRVSCSLSMPAQKVTLRLAGKLVPALGTMTVLSGFPGTRNTHLQDTSFGSITSTFARFPRDHLKC